MISSLAVTFQQGYAPNTNMSVVGKCESVTTIHADVGCGGAGGIGCGEQAMRMCGGDSRLTLRWVQEATTIPSSAAAVLMLAPPGGIHTSSPPLSTCKTALVTHLHMPATDMS